VFFLLNFLQRYRYIKKLSTHVIIYLPANVNEVIGNKKQTIQQITNLWIVIKNIKLIKVKDLNKKITLFL
jgi:hypothetical protein